jgi:hypothetical protein
MPVTTAALPVLDACLTPAWLQGMVSVVDPASSWCAKWLHLK